VDGLEAVLASRLALSKVSHVKKRHMPGVRP
jgi:hypothetical protein